MVAEGPSSVGSDRGRAVDESRPRFWRDALRRRMLALADLIAAAIASLVVAVNLVADGVREAYER